MNDRAIVTVSLVWLGLLVVLSRQWLGDAQTYISRVTGHADSTAAPATPASSAVSGFGPGGASGGGLGGGGGGSH